MPFDALSKAIHHWHRAVLEPMTLSQQAYVVLRCLELAQLPAEAVMHWADNAIAAEHTPPPWLLDLSTLTLSRFGDMLRLLQAHGELHRPREVDICILAHQFQCGRISAQAAFSRAFVACCVDYDPKTHPRTSPFEELADLLCELDQCDLARIEDGAWRQRLAGALAECQRESGELAPFVSGFLARHN